MIPPNIASPDVRAYEESVNNALRSAMEKSGIKYAVVLSSVGADKSQGTGPVAGLHNLEQKLEEIPGLNALFLRAGYFMENLLPQAGVIKAMGIMAGCSGTAWRGRNCPPAPARPRPAHPLRPWPWPSP